jgi:hypothetical protein
MTKRKLAAETAIMFTAQQLVDRWLRAHNRGPFSRAVALAEEQHWDADPGKEAHRRAFRHVANAIRIGKGHAVQNPAPLLEIMRNTMRQAAGVVPNGRRSQAASHPR